MDSETQLFGWLQLLIRLWVSELPVHPLLPLHQALGLREAAVAVAVAETHQTWAAALCNSLAATTAFGMRRGFECKLLQSLLFSPVPAVGFDFLCCLGSPYPSSFLPYSEAAASGGCFLAVLDFLCRIVVRYIFDVQKGALQLGGVHVLHMC